MNAYLLINAVVQQTMVFIAQLATAGGVRAPLAHVAGEAVLGFSARFTFVTQMPEDGGFSITPGPTTLDMGDGKTLTGTPRNPTPTTLPGLTFTCLH